MKNACEENGIFGEHFATDYLYRREYQVRGSQHDHGFFNLQTKEGIDEVEEFIDKHITCEYEENHPYMNFHVHHCTQTCYKGKSYKKKR